MSERVVMWRLSEEHLRAVLRKLPAQARARLEAGVRDVLDEDERKAQERREDHLAQVTS